MTSGDDLRFGHFVIPAKAGIHTFTSGLPFRGNDGDVMRAMVMEYLHCRYENNRSSDLHSPRSDHRDFPLREVSGLLDTFCPPVQAVTIIDNPLQDEGKADSQEWIYRYSHKAPFAKFYHIGNRKHIDKVE